MRATLDALLGRLERELTKEAKEVAKAKSADLKAKCSEAWKVLEEIHDLGQARSIGVSNFMPELLGRLLAAGSARIAVRKADDVPSAARELIREVRDASLGRTVVLCGSYETRDRLYEHLRPDGMQAGDGAMDMYGKYTQVHETPTGASVVSVDGGRRFARKEHLTQHVVVSPSTVRSAEYDTVIVMPDVPEMIAQAVCRRARYLVIGVGHSPYGYILD